VLPSRLREQFRQVRLEQREVPLVEGKLSVPLSVEVDEALLVVAAAKVVQSALPELLAPCIAQRCVFQSAKPEIHTNYFEAYYFS